MFQTALVNAVTKVDVSGLNADDEGRTCTSVSIEGIRYDIAGMKVRLLWDATTDVDCFVLGDSNNGTLCFKEFGGLSNNSGAGKTGDIKHNYWCISKRFIQRNFVSS